MSAAERLAEKAHQSRNTPTADQQAVFKYIKSEIPKDFGNKPVVVLATGSGRKLIDAYYKLTGDYPEAYHLNPMNHQEDFELNVFNGNGAFEGTVYLGFDEKRGIHIFGKSTGGELESHIAQDEATNKRNAAVAAWRSEFPNKEDHDVIFVSLDTVSKDGWGEYVGKPANEEPFDDRGYELIRSLRQGEALSPFEVIRANMYIQWMNRYLDAHYPDDGEVVVHTTAVSLWNVLTDQQLSDKLDYATPISRQSLSFKTADPYGSGAAAVQHAAGLGENYDQEKIKNAVRAQLEEYRDLVPRSAAEELYYQQLVAQEISIGMELLEQFQGMPFEFAMLLVDQMLVLGDVYAETINA